MDGRKEKKEEGRMKGRKEGRRVGRRKEGKERRGRKEKGRKEKKEEGGRMKGRKEGRKEKRREEGRKRKEEGKMKGRKERRKKEKEGIPEESKVEAPAFTDAVRMYRQSKEQYGTWDMLCGNEAQVLSNLVMEELLPELKNTIGPRLKGKEQERQRAWIQISDAVYRMVCDQQQPIMTHQWPDVSFRFLK
ncbi:niban-like 1 [Crotalus adamanteus]|uniref:Niban-like 1 n=1 Tax=Crotalus adamanteus TaxID=8729 RepID=A0AAW1ARU7_CROAD